MEHPRADNLNLTYSSWQSCLWYMFLVCLDNFQYRWGRWICQNFWYSWTDQLHDTVRDTRIDSSDKGCMESQKWAHACCSCRRWQQHTTSRQKKAKSTLRNIEPQRSKGPLYCLVTWLAWADMLSGWPKCTYLGHKPRYKWACQRVRWVRKDRAQIRILARR